jgi:hypothetical protein
MARGSTDWSINAVAWLYRHDARMLPEQASAA